MVALFEVLGIYGVVALTVMYGIWRLIGRQGFIGLQDTDSRLARHFYRPSRAMSDHRHAPSGVAT